MHISEFQKLMREKLAEKDREMGHLFLMNVLLEEVGELAKTVRRKIAQEVQEELADVIFCAVSLANIFDVEIEHILIQKYANRSLEEISQKWADVTWR